MNQKNGFGKYTYNNGDVYIGSWRNDKQKGKGKMIYKNGDIFEGMFDQDHQEGGGTWSKWNITGQLKDGKLEGTIKMSQTGEVI